MFTATLNRTLTSYIKAIIGAEYILRWLPVGTHDWFKFVEPEKLQNLCEKNDLKLSELDGLNYNLFLDKWQKSKKADVNYISIFEKI